MSDDEIERYNAKFKEPRTIWDVYNKQAQKRDDYLAEDWKSGIGNLLIFAGIFAAAVTSLCVETRKMLEPDPQVATQTILLAMAAKMDNNSLSAVPSLDYVPENWAIQVNYLFFVSLTSSLVASLGGIICLQWVGGYNDGLETGGDARMRALQRHSRYRAANKWYMRHFIVGLHLLLFCAVIFFLAGLSLWFWHIYRNLAAIPLLGLLLWVVGYLITTLLAAVHPFAPYRNSISRVLFRIISMLGYWLWSVRNILPCIANALYRVLSQRRQIPRTSREWKGISGAWKRFREEFVLDQTLAVQSFVKRVATGYPWDPAWMASSRTYWMAMHSSLWELGKVNQDNTLPLATLAWLARTLGQSKSIIDDLALLLKELSCLTPAQLQKWRSAHFNAPWMQIINLLLRHRKDAKTREAIADVLLKMSNNAKLFERFAVDMERHTVEFFLHQLAANPLRGQQSPRQIQHYEICDADADAYEQAIINEAENRLTSLTAVLASNLWITEQRPDVKPKHLANGSAVTQKTSGELIPGILLDALERCNAVSPTDATTLWVFTIYKTDPLAKKGAESSAPGGPSSSQIPKEHTEDNDTGLLWPNPLVYDFKWRAFGKPSLRIQAIAHYFSFLELYLTGNHIEIPGMTLQWQVPAKDPETTRVLMEILTHHLLRLHANNRIRPHPDDPSGSLLVDLQSKLTSPSLKLICSVMDLNRLSAGIKFPKHEQTLSPGSKTTVWHEDVWKQAVLFWCGIRPGWDNDTCAIQDADRGVIEQAVLLVETMTTQNDWHLNSAIEELIYRLAPHLKIDDWVQFIAIFFRNGLRGNPSTVVSRVVRLLLRLSPTSASDRLREIIYKKMIQPARTAENNPLQLQIKRVSGEGSSEGKLGVREWYQLVNEYSKRRRMKELGTHIRLQFKLDELLRHIQRCIRHRPDVLELETSSFRALMVIYKATAYQYLRLAQRQQRLEENTLRHMSGKPKRGLLPELNIAPIQFHKKEDITVSPMHQVPEAEEPVIDKRDAILRPPDGIGIRRKLNQHLEILKSIQSSFGKVEEILRELRKGTLDIELAAQDPSQIDPQEIPSADTPLRDITMKVKDISKLVEAHWCGWMMLFKGMEVLK